MTIEARRRAIEAALDIYRNRLDAIPDDRFDLTPPDGGWSYAEVYSHILQATLGSGIAVEKCAMNTIQPTTKGRTVLGFLVLTFNRFPPIRVKAPAAVLAKRPVNKTSKEEARNLIIKCRKRIEDAAPLIRDASINRRINHARFGMLNAAQWFKFILIHLKHHLKQLDRIDKSLGRS